MKPALRTALRVHDLVIRGMAALAAILIGALVVVISLDVLLRNTGNGNLPWSLEVSEYALYGATLLATPWVLALRAHVAMDLLPGLLSNRARARLHLVVCALGLAICAVLGWQGAEAVAVSAARGAMIYKTLIFPEWWLLALFPLVLALLALGFVRMAFEGVTGPDAARGH